MRYGVPLLTERVAPRLSCADEMLVVTLSRGRVTSHKRVPLGLISAVDLIPILKSLQIDTLVCGGVRRETRQLLQSHAVTVIDNVACSVTDVFAAVESGTLRPGYGFDTRSAGNRPPGDVIDGIGHAPSGVTETSGSHATQASQIIDCVRCADRRCLRGHNCFPNLIDAGQLLSPEMRTVLEAATDVSREDERKLCRLSELVYFCLELDYRRVGIAFCVDLLEPAEILARVLGRFFEVHPVCCKVGGILPPDSEPALCDSDDSSTARSMACNPIGQARVLNHLKMDLNVVVGLCVGADCIFARESDAPVTTLFVKDKSLANNPIGAVYSEYYLRESLAPGPALTSPSGTGRSPISFGYHQSSSDVPGRGERS